MRRGLAFALSDGDVAARWIRGSEDVYRRLDTTGAPARVAESVWAALLDARGNSWQAMGARVAGSTTSESTSQRSFARRSSSAPEALSLPTTTRSGVCIPSDEDHTFTHRVHDAANLLGVTLLDHVVGATDGYFSFADAGRLQTTCA